MTLELEEFIQPQKAMVRQEDLPGIGS